MDNRLITIGDAKRLSEYYLDNLDHFKRWEPIKTRSFHLYAEWQKRIVEYLSSQERGDAAYFVATSGNEIVAHCSLTQIYRGAFQACYMGYGVSHKFEGRGVAYSLCEFVISYAFKELSLHRIMANYMPHNNRSGKLLDRLGFVREGVAKNYLKINGRWENHVLTSLTAGENA
jgi:ribosomal-protein-alanine N-acetyltransferase